MSNIDRVQHYAVDIGNSGLRIVKLPASDSLDLPVPCRINWLLGGEKLDSSKPRSFEGPRFRPDDPLWTKQLLQFCDLSVPTHWWISSVNRPASEVLLNFLQDARLCEIKLINFNDLPLSIEVDFPERVGVDRLLASLAACQLSKSNRLIVIQAGSAVTVDLAETTISHSSKTLGRFLGGAILPGVPMMLRLLGKAADLLPELDAEEFVNLPPLPGKNTEAAMLAGSSSCLVGGVQHVVSRYRLLVGKDAPIVLSGGDGPLLISHLEAPVVVVPHLVLQGIRAFAKANSQN